MDKFPKYHRQYSRLPSAGMLNDFKKKYPKYSDMTYKEFSNVIKTFNQKVIDGVIENREGVMLPELLGYMFIGSSKTKKKVRSYTKFTDNVAKRYNNMETDGRLMKVYFTFGASKVPIKHFRCWTFRAQRNMRRRASEEFKKDYKKYVDTEHVKINEFYNIRKDISNSDVKILQNHNELDL